MAPRFESGVGTTHAAVRIYYRGRVCVLMAHHTQAVLVLAARFNASKR